jgi:siroheme synthase
MLEEKIAIEELRNGNKAKQETINQLKSKMNELEQRLRKVSGDPNSFGPTSEAVPEVVETPKPIEEPMDVSEPVQEEPEEEVITVTALEEPMAAEQEEIGESLNRQHEKKKRRFL